MDNNHARDFLMEREGNTLYSTTMETVESFQKENDWFVRVTAQYEGEAKPDVMEMKMESFRSLYRQQTFSKQAPSAPASGNGSQGDVGEF